MKTIFLSHFIDKNTPLYGGEKTVFIEEKSKISEGASSNTKYLKLPNHSGTHIDFPNHFSNSGKSINDYNASFWRFNKVFVISFETDFDEIINEENIGISDIPIETEFLIINTGFGVHREKMIYWKNNPGLSPKLARDLKLRCSKLKVIGFDFISLSSYQNRILGREAHKEFLLNNDILIIEDMKLDELQNKTIIFLTALPWQINKADGAPITIIAEYEEN